MTRKRPARRRTHAVPAAPRFPTVSRLEISFRRSAVEWLESRLCLSTAYSFDVIAKTGDTVSYVDNQTGPSGTLTAVGQLPSINNSGDVAFVGQYAGGNGVFVGDGTAAEQNITPGLSGISGRTFGGAVQINDAGQVLAVDRASGAPPSYYLRLWNASTGSAQIEVTAGTGSDSLTSIFLSGMSLSNTGGFSYVAFNGASVLLNSSAGTVATLPSPEPTIQPMLADNGDIVARAGSTSSSPVDVYNPAPPASFIASASNGFSALGAEPGISDDGSVVAFYGDSSASGPGIYAAVNSSTGWATHEITGVSVSGPLTALSADTRVGVSQWDPTSNSTTITYIATGHDGEQGIYTSRLTLDAGSGQFSVSDPTLVVEVGDSIPGLSGTVASLNTYDPINGKGQLAFYAAMSDGSQAIVRADPDFPDLVALPNDSPVDDNNFFWNPLTAGGGFTFTYRIDNPGNEQLADSTIEFDWQQSSGVKSLAYKFALNASAVDSTNEPAEGSGTHSIVVTQQMLIAQSQADPSLGESASPPDSAPGNINGSPGQSPDTLVATLDPTDANHPYGTILESDETNNHLILTVVPLVVDVVSPGFNPLPEIGQQSFLAPFVQLASDMQQIPAVDSTLYDRVASYVSQWDSTSSFRPGIIANLLSFMATAESQLATQGGDTVGASHFPAAAAALASYAASTAGSSDFNLIVAAMRIVDDLTQPSANLLLPPNQSNALQVINLTGHSRGAELNAYIAYLLNKLGYHNIADYVSLDGYSSDWSSQTPGSGVLTNMNIPDLLQGLPISNGAFNFRAAQGLAFELPTPLTTLLSLVAPPLSQVLTQFQADTDLRAPYRDGFINWTVPLTVHTTITTTFDQQLWQLYGDLAGNIGAEGYLYLNLDDGFDNSPSQSAASKPSSAALAMPSRPANRMSQNASATTAASSTSPPPTGFFDGTIEQLGALDLQNQAVGTLTTGDPDIDAGLQTMLNQANTISLFWQTTGDVTLSHAANNTALKLDEADGGSASVAQTIALPDKAASVEFDLGVQKVAAGDTLQVLLNGTTLQSIDLIAAPASGHESIALPDNAPTIGTFAFQLSGAGTSPVTASLDNFLISTNHPPVLTAIPDQNVVLGNQLSLTAHATDLDAGDLLSYSLDPGAPAGAAIDPHSGVLTWAPTAAADAGAHAVTVRVTDNGAPAKSDATSFTITAEPNQAPTFFAGPDQAVAVGAGAQTVAGWATDISPGSPSEASQTLTFVVTGDTNPALFSVPPSVDPATGNLTYTPAPNGTGSSDIALVLHDNGGTAGGGQDASATQTFIISVESLSMLTQQTSLEIVNVTQARPVSGSTTFNFTVSLSTARSFPISVDYSTSDGTATVAHGDYKPQVGTLTFEPSETSKTISVTVNAGSQQGAETFFVNLANAVRATIHIPNGVGAGIILPVQTGGTSYYVNDASTVGDVFCTAPGSNNNTGEGPSEPLASVNALMSLHQLHTGDTVYIDTGVYPLATNIVLAAQESGVRFVGAGQRQPVPSLDPGTILADNPVALWPLGDASGTNATDVTGHGFDGTYLGGVTPISTGPGLAGAAEFANGKQLVTVPDAPDLNPVQFTIEAWIKYNGNTGVDEADIVRTAYQTGSWAGYALTISHGLLYFFDDAGFTYNDAAAAPMPEGEWTYVVGTFDGTTLALYVDGTLAATHVPPESLAPSTAPLEIGGQVEANDFDGGMPYDPHFADQLADVALYDRVLTPAQIAAHFDAVIWRGTVLDRRNTSSGTAVFDLSGAQNVSIANLSIQGADVGINAADGAGSTGAVFSGLDIGNCADYDADLGTSSDGAQVVGNILHGAIPVAIENGGFTSGGDQAIWIRGNNDNIVGNTVFGSGSNGIWSEGTSEVISGNVAFGNGWYYDPNFSYGIYVDGVNYGAGISDVITGNETYDDAGGIYVTNTGASSPGADVTVVSDNVIHDNGNIGIFTSAGNGGQILVESNRVFDIVGAAAYYGANASPLAIAGYGIVLGGSGNVATDNVSFANIYGVVQFSTNLITPTNADVIAGNIAYNDSGAGLLVGGGTTITGNEVFEDGTGIIGSDELGSDVIDGAFHGQIDHNVIYGNTQAGVSLFNAYVDPGTNGATIISNTITIRRVMRYALPRPRTMFRCATTFWNPIPGTGSM